MNDDLHALVVETGAALTADRCWLYARDPERREGIALVRWLRTAAVTDVPADIHRWNPEAPDLVARDPLFARALAGAELDSVDDTQTAQVDPELERALGHRAFIHLNLHVDGVLWGTFQPGMTETPRIWTDQDRGVLLRLRPILAALVAEQARRRAPSTLLIGPRARHVPFGS